MFGEVLEHSERTLTTAGCGLQQAGERAGARQGAYPIKTQPPTPIFPRLEANKRTNGLPLADGRASRAGMGGTAARPTASPQPQPREEGTGRPNDLRGRS